MHYQKWLIKIILGKKRDYSSNDLYRESGFFDIRQTFSLTLLVYQRKYILSSKLVHHIYNTRYKERALDVPKMAKTIGQRCYVFLAPKLFNKIPIEIKNLNSLSLFKQEAKKWINMKSRNEIHDLINLKNAY